MQQSYLKNHFLSQKVQVNELYEIVTSCRGMAWFVGDKAQKRPLNSFLVFVPIFHCLPQPTAASARLCAKASPPVSMDLSLWLCTAILCACVLMPSSKYKTSN